MIRYYPFNTIKPNDFFTLVQMIIKRFILVRLPPLILHYMKMSSTNNNLLIGTRIMEIGINPESIAQGFGCRGIYQQQLQVIKILKQLK
jgi:hypothetical protein